MYSTAILLLVACFVAVSSQSIEVHVTGLSPRHSQIEFKNKAGKNHTFLLSSAITAANNVQVKDNKIEELALKVLLVPVSAAIVACPVQPNIIVKSASYCRDTENCLQRNTDGKTYHLYVSNIGEEQKTLTCTGVQNQKTFTIGDRESTLDKDITFVKGIIKEDNLSFGFEPQECEIAKVDALPDVKVMYGSSCSELYSNCFNSLLIDGEYYAKVYVEYLKVTHDKLVFNGFKGESKTFRLGSEPTGDDNVYVYRGKIREERLKVGFKIQQPALVKSFIHPSIKINLAETCEGNENCFKKNADKQTYSLYVSNVSKAYETMTCTEVVRIKKFNLVDHGASLGDNIKITNGVINETALPIASELAECVVDETAGVDAIPIDKNDECSAENANCFKTSAAFEISLKLGLFAICLVLGKIL